MAPLELIIIVFLTLIVSTLPLYFAVKILGGKTSFLKTLLIMIIASIVTTLITAFFPFGSFIAFIILIFIYREAFRLKWIKAFFAWLLQLLFVALISILLLILGVSVSNFGIFG